MIMKGKTVLIERFKYSPKGFFLSRPAGEGRPVSSIIAKSACILSLLAFVFILSGCSSGEDIDPKTLRGGETRATLSPAYFTGSSAKAYLAAREIPEVLDSLHCYCECKKHLGHKSLLTCFVDQHGLHCDTCINEAVMAHEMHKKGKSILEIRRAVDKEFSGN